MKYRFEYQLDDVGRRELKAAACPEKVLWEHAKYIISNKHRVVDPDSAMEVGHFADDCKIYKKTWMTKEVILKEGFKYDDNIKTLGGLLGPRKMNDDAESFNRYQSGYGSCCSAKSDPMSVGSQMSQSKSKASKQGKKGGVAVKPGKVLI